MLVMSEGRGGLRKPGALSVEAFLATFPHKPPCGGSSNRL